MGRAMTVLIPLNLNESPYPPLPSVAAALHEWVRNANRYPEFVPDTLRGRVADHLGVPGDWVSVGAGATGLAYQVLQAFCPPGGRMLTAVPTFDGYPILADLAGVQVDAVPLRADGGTDLVAMAAAIRAETRVVVLCSPHNPTGSVISEPELHRFLARVPRDVVVILDQAYFEFADYTPDLHLLLLHHPNVVALRTFSKAHGLAALRVGYAVGAVQLISKVRRFEVPFAVGSAASLAVPAALAATDALRQRVRTVRDERIRLQANLADIGITSLPSQANHVFVPTERPQQLAGDLVAGGVAAKVCATPGALRGVRITVGDTAATDSVIAALIEDQSVSA